MLVEKKILFFRGEVTGCLIRESLFFLLMIKPPSIYLPSSGMAFQIYNQSIGFLPPLLLFLFPKFIENSNKE